MGREAVKMPPASRQLSRGGQIVGCSRVEEQGAGLSRRPDAELRLRAVDVVLNGAGRDIENEPDVGEGLSLRRQSEALPFAAGQVDAGDNQKGFQLFAHLPVELISDEPQRKRVTPGGVQEGCVLFIGGEGERGKAAMPVMDRNGVTVTDAEAGGSAASSSSPAADVFGARNLAVFSSGRPSDGL